MLHEYYNLGYAHILFSTWSENNHLNIIKKQNNSGTYLNLLLLLKYFIY